MIDYNHPPLWYCILFALYLMALVLIIRDGIRRKAELSRGSFAARVYGAGFLAVVGFAGVALRIWIAVAGR